MINTAQNSRLETGNGWMRVRSPGLADPLWLAFVPAAGVAIAAFYWPFLWVVVGFFASAGGLQYMYAVNVYPEFEVRIDFEKREITWSDAYFNKSHLAGWPLYIHRTERLSFDQIEYLSTGPSMIKKPVIGLVLKNGGKRMVLSVFDSLRSRDKVLSALESHLHQRLYTST